MRVHQSTAACAHPLLPPQMVLPVALGFAAGCMIWMVFAELLPDALERAEGAQVGGLPALGIACA